MVTYHRASKERDTSEITSKILFGLVRLNSLIKLSANGIKSFTEMQNEGYDRYDEMVCYDDKNELTDLCVDDEKVYPIVYNLFRCDSAIINYFDKSTTGINADVVVVTNDGDRYIRVTFADNDEEELIIENGKCSIL